MERYTKIAKQLEDNPNTQITFHKRMMRIWAVNAPIILCLYISTYAYPAATIHVVGFITFYTAMISLYANWVSDFDGLSAAQSTLETLRQEALFTEKPTTTDVTPAHLINL